MSDELILEPGFTRNPGYCPVDAEGKRVEVILRNGSHPSPDPIAQAVPGGWAASGKGRCRWTLIGSPFDILQYRVIK